MNKFNKLSKQLTTFAISTSMLMTMPGMANLAYANVNQQNENLETISEVEYVAEINGTGYLTLQEAFEEAEDGNEILLLKNVEVDEMILVNKELNLNMGDNNTITFTEGAIDTAKKLGNFTIEGGQLNIDGSGSIEEEVPYYAPIMLKGATDSNASSYSVLTVGEDISLSGWSGIFVRQNGNAAYGVFIDMNGSAVAETDGETAGAGIYVNGSITETEGNIPEIIVGESAILSSDESTGLYLAGYADTYVYGKLNGCESGVEIRAGKLTIDDSAEISSTYVPTEEESNGNGSAIDGAAIAIAQHTTKLPIEVSVYDGMISGYTALYQSDPEQNNDGENITIEVSGGIFETIEDSDTIVYSKDKTGFISGGTYNIKPDEKYIAEGYVITEIDNGFEVVLEENIEDDEIENDENQNAEVIIEGPSEIEVYAGETIQLMASTNESDKNIIWESSNENIAIVDENGFVKIVGKHGSANITAKIEGSTKSAKCRIEVKKQTLNAEVLALPVDGEIGLEIIGNFTTTDWKSSDETVATVDEYGIIKAVGTGTAIITVKINDLIEINCDVVVAEKSVVGFEGKVKSDVDIDGIIEGVLNDAEIPEDVEHEEEYLDDLQIAIELAFDDIFDDMSFNSIMEEPVEELVEAAEDTLKNQVLEDGDKALIYVNIEIMEMDSEIEINNENSEIEINIIPKSITFKVNPMIKIFDAEGNIKEDNQVVENEQLDGSFKIYLPIPSSITEEFANIIHSSEGYQTETYCLPILNNDGEKYVEMTLEHFSEFEVTFTNENSNNDDSNTGDDTNTDTDNDSNMGEDISKEESNNDSIKGSYSSSKSSSGKKVETTKKQNKINGTWVSDENGWWFRYEDGTWPVEKWVELEWNGKLDHYYFDENGYMHTGWLLKDGLWYYLHPISDGTKGHMYTGWHMIDDAWYFFNDGAVSELGSLLVNTTTPDGFKVDANGAWVK